MYCQFFEAYAERWGAELEALYLDEEELKKSREDRRRRYDRYTRTQTDSNRPTDESACVCVCVCEREGGRESATERSADQPIDDKPAATVP